MKTYSFIKESEIADKLTPEFVDAFDDIMPQWLGVLIPAYEECKKQGACLFDVANVIDDWSDSKHFESNGFSYILSERSGYKTMSYDAHGDYNHLSWLQYLRFKYHTLYTNNIKHAYQSTSKEITDFMHYHWYTTRTFNKHAPYNFIAERIKEYFQKITNDPDVIFSFGNECYIALNDDGEKYVRNSYRYFS